MKKREIKLTKFRYSIEKAYTKPIFCFIPRYVYFQVKKTRREKLALPKGPHQKKQ
jgi:hypothetical protein